MVLKGILRLVSLLAFAVICASEAAAASAEGEGGTAPQSPLASLVCEKEVQQTVQDLVFKNGGASLPPELRLSVSSLARMFKSLLAVMPEQPSESILDSELEKLGRSSGLGEEALREIKSFITDKNASLKVPAFLEKRVVVVGLANEVPEYCDGFCQDLIEDTVVISLSAWRAYCLPCASDFLAVIQGRTRVWTDHRVMIWLGDTSRTLATFPLPTGAGAIGQLAVLANAERGSALSKATPLHQPLMKESPEHKALCKLDPELPGTPAALRLLAKAVCTGQVQQGEEVATVNVALKRGSTSCGPARYYLGCGRPDNTVELTFDKTAFDFVKVGSNERRRVGPLGVPEFLGNAVVMHEVGHWFGVPHINFRPDSIPDLMQGVYQRNGCITPLSFMQITNMTNVDYPQRLRKGAGLARPDAPPIPP